MSPRVGLPIATQRGPLTPLGWRLRTEPDRAVMRRTEKSRRCTWSTPMGPVRLDKACGSGTDNFQPNFSPFDEGGYFWVVFLSRRDYGNATAGTRGTQRQQLWVAAINKDGTADPSQVPYWLPGQDSQHKNIAAFYAPRACREDGDSCTVNSECCGGDCRPDMSGNLVCAPPPPEKCRKLNETCSTSADCCDERECVNNVCVDQIPK